MRPEAGEVHEFHQSGNGFGKVIFSVFIAGLLTILAFGIFIIASLRCL